MSAAPETPASADPLPDAWTQTWEGWIQMQQRWWAEWAEGVQLWTSWWLTPQPPVTPGEWAQTTAQGLRTADETTQSLIAEATESLAAPQLMTPHPARSRAPSRPH